MIGFYIGKNLYIIGRKMEYTHVLLSFVLLILHLSYSDAGSSEWSSWSECTISCQSATRGAMFGHRRRHRVCLRNDCARIMDTDFQTCYPNQTCIGTFTQSTITTPKVNRGTLSTHDYANINQFGFIFEEEGYIEFSITTCTDALFALFNDDVLTGFEFIIGGWSNTKAAIRTMDGYTRGALLTEFSGTFVDCDSPQRFRVSWQSRLLQLHKLEGSVYVEKIKYTSPKMLTFNCIAVSGYMIADVIWTIHKLSGTTPQRCGKAFKAFMSVLDQDNAHNVVMNTHCVVIKCCAILCNREIQCLSFSFNESSNRCQGYGTYYGLPSTLLTSNEKRDYLKSYYQPGLPNAFNYFVRNDLGITYKVLQLQLNYTNALEFCSLEYAGLLTIDTMSKLSYIQNFWSTSYMLNLYTLEMYVDGQFLGGYWVFWNGAEVPNDLWATGQPSLGQSCVVITKNGLKTADCTLSKGFICGYPHPR